MRNALIVFLLGIASVIYGQSPQINNPLTTQGLGLLSQSGLDDTYYTGSLFSSNRGEHTYNIHNPASLGYLTNYTLFGAGLTGGLHSYEIDGSSETYSEGNLGYFYLAVPFFNQRNEFIRPDSARIRIGMGTFLKQTSRVGYDIESFRSVGEDEYEVDFAGAGGISTLGLDFGVKYRTLAGGLGFEYQFGKITDDYAGFFVDDQSTSFTNQVNEETRLRAFKVKPGVLIDVPFKDFFKINKINKDTSYTELEKLKRIEKVRPLVLTLGARATIPFFAQSTLSQVVRRRNFFAENVLPVDTILSIEDRSTNIEYPTEFGIGAVVLKPGVWKLGVDAGYTNWSALKTLSRSSELNDSWKVSVGGEFTPFAFDITNYLNRIQYRTTLYLGQDYLNVNNESINNYGIGFGFGLPIRLAKFTDPAFVNIGADLGRYDSENSFYSDNYLRFNIGFTLSSDGWFLKQKIN